MDMMAIRRRAMMAQKRLPKEYQEVEYIESTGPQWIDTGISTYKLVTVDLVTQFTIAGTASQVLFCGSTNGPNWFGQRNKVYACGSGGRELSGIDSDLKKKVKITYFDKSIVCNIDETEFMRTGSHDNSYRYKLFNEDYPSNAKVFSCVIYYNDEKIGNYVPCYRKSDGEIGLYDLVLKTFLKNRGTGTFEKGPDV